MNVENKICPYPGLRPFNEDESIFFKGREEHIEQIIHQLEAKKFLMLTGASGDGKSSLVYAGVIPNARAGFFRAKFNNWVVADFRPERTPLKNFTSALCYALDINKTETVERELSYGFSALIDLYKSSSHYLDQDADEYKTLDEAEKKKRKRKAANLLILVDQFEEFFTNVENYLNGKPSFESLAVVNLILETAKIALAEDIPIFIICTMRSDYIGQCASFRNLPEYIGFSQFFVPRLKRNELYQVIEEPAILNGDKISKRLVETLISQLDEGVDQLPVLQHALNQVWQNAGNGNDEMDLLHLAKTGGLNKKYLNTNDRKIFDDWLNALPEYKKPFFSNPSLDNVLDTHANELYEVAAKEVNSKYDEPKLTERDAKTIIETAFKCLTKIDEGRSVRNRMTLQEIAHIINREDISASLAGEVLNIYRKQGNTFIKPFITEDAKTGTLHPDNILDITHESLIRNWSILGEWTKEEYDDLLNFQDFNKQLQRWVKNKKSSDFLLPIGPLTFFESWFHKAKPNKHWLVKYDTREIPHEQKVTEAELTLQHAAEFIKKSARRLFISRTVLRYGADKIIAAFGLLLLIISCMYFTYDFSHKQNEYVINDIQQKSNSLLESKYIKNKAKADYIITAERLNPGSYKTLLNIIQADSDRLDIVRNMIVTCLQCQEGKKDLEADNPMLGPLFLHQVALFNKNKSLTTGSSLVKNVNNVLSIVYEHILIKRDNYKPQLKEIDSVYNRFCADAFNAGIHLLDDTVELKKIEINQFNKLLQTFPELVSYDSSKVRQLVDLITPFNTNNQYKFNLLYPKDKTVDQEYNEKITHNGGYFQLANLYAICGDFNNLNNSFDSIINYNKNFVNVGSGYSYIYLLYDLIICKKITATEGLAFVDKIKSKLVNKGNFSLLISLQEALLGNGISVWSINRVVLPQSKACDYMIAKDAISYKQVNELIDFNIAQNLTDNKLKPDEKNYMAALLYKERGFADNFKECQVNYEKVNDDLKNALSYFDKVSISYLNENINIGTGGTDNKSIKRSDVFKYPGYIALTGWTWQTYSTYGLQRWRDVGIFIDYITKANRINEFYNNEEVLGKFLLNYSPIILKNLDDESVHNADIKPFIYSLSMNDDKMDKDVIYAFLTLYYYKTNQTTSAAESANKINYINLFKKEKITDQVNSSAFISLAYRLSAYCSISQRVNEQENNILESSSDVHSKQLHLEVINALPFGYLKRNALLVMIDSMQERHNDAIAIALTDTLLNSYIAIKPTYGDKFFHLLGRYNAMGSNRIAMKLLKDKDDEIKPGCLNLFIKGLAQSNNYFKAISFIPEYISSENQLILYTTILNNERKLLRRNNGWSAINFEPFSWYTDYERSETGGSGIMIMSE